MPEIVVPVELKAQNPEDRFGDREKVETILRDAKILSFVSIDRFLKDEMIAHSNQVDIASLQSNPESLKRAFSSNLSLLSLIDTENGILPAVFKPEDGESRARRQEFSINKLWPREIDGYMVDRAIGFNVIPPTVERTLSIDGVETIGSLQLFILRKYALPVPELSDENRAMLEASEDWMKIAIIDYLINNADRKDDNMLATPDGLATIAIDHGCAFCKLRESDIVGPRKVWRGRSIPAGLISKIGEFNNKVPDLISHLHDEVRFRQTLEGESIQAKVDKLLETEIFQ